MGTNAVDSTVNNRNGTYVEPITYRQASLIAAEPSVYSVTIPGGSSSITTTYAGWAASVTMTGWAYRTSTAANHTLVGTFPAVTFDTILRTGSGNTNIEFFSNSNIGSVTWTAVCPTATAFHWALTYNNATFVSELFINSVSQGTKTSSAGYNGPGSVQWGAWSGGNSWNGQQSYNAIFSSTLSVAEIAFLFSGRDVPFSWANFPKPSLRR